MGAAPGLDVSAWTRLRSLFDEAKELSPLELLAFIEENCGADAALGERLRSLVEAHQQSSSLLDRSIPERIRALPMPEPEPLDDPEGTLINGRYLVESQIGQGGAAIVYRASDAHLGGRLVALKLARYRSTKALINSAEVEALARVHHHGVAAPIDAGVTPDGRAFVVLEFASGSTLRECLASGPLPVPRALRLVRQMASALDKVHLVGVWHLDLKPENVMVEEAGSPNEQTVLVDFGIARLATETGISMAAGSIRYMAPEQFDGRPAAVSDQYALALIAAEMLTGVAPAGGLPPLRKLPKGVQQVLLRAASHDPGCRYEHCSAFALALARAVDRVRLGLRGALAAGGVLVLAGAAFWSLQALQTEARLRIDQQSVAIEEATNRMYEMISRNSVSAQTGVSTLQTLADQLRELRRSPYAGPATDSALLSALQHLSVAQGHPGIRSYGKTLEATKVFQEAREIAYSLARQAPDDWLARERTAALLDNQASILIEAGKYSEAELLLREAVHWIDLEHLKDPKLLRVAREALVGNSLTLSRIRFHERNYEECLRLRNGAVQHYEQQYHKGENIALEYAGALAVRGYLLRDMGRLDEAICDYTNSDSILLKAIDTLKEDATRVRWYYARNGIELAKALIRLGRTRQAQTRLQDSVDWLSDQLQRVPTDNNSRRSLATGLSLLAMAQRRTGQPAARACAIYFQALEENGTARRQDPGNAKAIDEAGAIREIGEELRCR